MEYVLRANALTKTYGKHRALNGFSMNVPKGAIYGFVGKNGAGKTTLIRLVCGLQIPTEGDYSIYGVHYKEKEIVKSSRRVGALEETPSIYSELTAEDNLKEQYRILGLPSFDGIEDILKLVGLGDTGRKKVKNFSMGMKQRLGIAISLMRNPDFLILDEPMNGLDPAGIREIRELLQKLNREKQITILISSHILDELARVATHYGIIRDGKLIEEFGAADLEERCRRCLKLVVGQPEQAAKVLEEELAIQNYDVPESGILRVFEGLEDTARINGTLAKNGISLREIYISGQDLEGYFMELVGK